MKIIFVNRVFWPEQAATAQLLHDVTVRLARRGCQVVVLTGPSPSRPSQENVKGVRIVRVGSPARRFGGAIMQRLLVYLSFLKRIRKAIGDEVEVDDLVIGMTDPPLLGVVIGQIARRHGARVWHWSQDVYPEVAIALSSNSALRFCLQRLVAMRDREWHRCEGIAAIGTDMAQLVGGRHVDSGKIKIVPNWAPDSTEEHATSSLPSSWDPQENFVVAYSGNLGRAHSLTPIVKIAEVLRNNQAIQFWIIGDGAQRKDLEEQVAQRNLQNITFKPPVDRAHLHAALAVPHLHFITMRSSCVGTVWPSKFYGIVQAERPILFIGPREAEVSRQIEGDQLGASFDPAQSQAAAAYIEKLYSETDYYQKIRENVTRRSSKAPGSDSVASFWQKVANSPPPALR